MDNLCHTLTGAALGRAGLADKTPFGMVTLMVAANLPDVDVAVFLTDTLPMSFRRGWTHVSYTLVLDDNWPSRRTGEGLGGTLRANYLAYRREFARR